MTAPGTRRVSYAVLRATLLAAGVLGATDARALLDDTLEVSASEMVGHDSNVFRISNGRDPATFLGSSSKADSYNVTTLGVGLDLPVSRQRFKASYAVNDVRYDHFSALNFHGYNGQAQWLWQAGNWTSGRFAYTESYALASLSNFQTPVPNPLRVKQTLFDATHMLTPSWRLMFGASDLRQENGDPARQANDAEVTAANASFGYLSRAGNFIGAGITYEGGRFPVPLALGGMQIDNGYTQRGANLLLDWTITAKSRVYARAGVGRRTYEQLTQRDYDGVIGRAEYEWKATAKLTLVATLQHDISPYEEIRTSFVRVNGAALRSTFRMTEKTTLSASLERAVRRYLGDAQTVLGFSPERVDRVGIAALTLAWQPTRVATVLLSAQREARTSTIDFGDYSATVVRATARLAF